MDNYFIFSLIKDKGAILYMQRAWTNVSNDLYINVGPPNESC